MHRLFQQDVRRDTLGRDKTNVTAVLIRDCAIITWRGGEGEKLEGGYRRK